MLADNLRLFGTDGRSYSYDHRATGYGRGEGVGMIVLKPLEDAIRNRDKIHAVIRHTGTNQDGKTSGPTMPSLEAQERLIKSVYSQAGLDPLDTHYVEAHGTGTSVGDPIEASAIARSLAKDRPIHKPLYVGSVKSNIGHLEAGSGLAGIIKASLVLQNGLIPPNINFEKANEAIPFETWKLKVRGLKDIYNLLTLTKLGSHNVDILAFSRNSKSFYEQLWFWWYQRRT